MTEIYLDNNATTVTAPEVVEAMKPYIHTYYGNPSSLHQMGVDAERAVTDARHKLAQSLNVNSSEVVFTSGATESINTALRGIAEANSQKGKHIVTTLVEHDCVLESCRVLEEDGFEVTYLTTDRYGRVDPGTVAEAVRDDTTVVAVMHVNNELGTLYPVADIARSVKDVNPNVAIVCDGVQAFGKRSVDLSHIDAYALSAHKIHGPKGVGALVVKPKVRMKPLIVGGGQESHRRSGTHNVPGIVGLGVATELAYHNVDIHQKTMKICRDELVNAVSEIDGTVVNSPEDGLESTLNVAFPGIPAETLLHVLEEQRVFVSTGSACASNKDITSHVLNHITDDPDVRQSSIRFSFSRYSQIDDIKRVGEILRSEVPSLRQIYGHETK